MSDPIIPDYSPGSPAAPLEVQAIPAVWDPPVGPGAFSTERGRKRSLVLVLSQSNIGWSNTGEAQGETGPNASGLIWNEREQRLEIWDKRSHVLTGYASLGGPAAGGPQEAAEVVSAGDTNLQPGVPSVAKEFAKILHAQTGNQVECINLNSHGGAELHNWLDGVGASDVGYDGYNRVLPLALPDGIDGFDSMFLLFVQGESDNGDAATWRDRVPTVISNLRGTNWASDATMIVFGELLDAAGGAINTELNNYVPITGITNSVLSNHKTLEAQAGEPTRHFMNYRHVALSMADAAGIAVMPGVELLSTQISGQVTLNWKWTGKHTPLYRVYRSKGADGPWEQVGTSVTTTYIDTTVKDGTRYYYRVTAETTAPSESAKESPLANAEVVDIVPGTSEVLWDTFEGTTSRQAGRAVRGGALPTNWDKLAWAAANSHNTGQYEIEFQITGGNFNGDFPASMPGIAESDILTYDTGSPPSSGLPNSRTGVVEQLLYSKDAPPER